MFRVVLLGVCVICQNPLCFEAVNNDCVNHHPREDINYISFLTMSMKGGKFFRPPPPGEVAPFDDSSDDSSDDESHELKKRNNINNTRLANLSDDSEDDSDDDDDSEEDDEELKGKKRKADKQSSKKKSQKKPKIKAKSFFDEEAEDAGESDLDEDEEVYGSHYDPHDRVKKHYTEDDIRREHLDPEAEEAMRKQDQRRRQEGRLDFTQLSAADMAREIEQRHRMRRRIVDRNIVEEELGPSEIHQFSAVSQQSLVPSISDPTLWMFTCIPGKEQELVVQIMNKCKAYASQGKPLGITGAVAAQTKGKIYVESFSEPSVIEVVQGIRNLLPYTMRIVPINDMTTVMTVVQKSRPVLKNDWVRMTRGHYKGDLALVVDVKDGGLKAIIQCVPRLDLTLATLNPDEARIRRKTVRPPQKFFNASEILALGRFIQRQRFPGGTDQCDYFEGSFYRDGYLLKEVKVGSVIKNCTEEDPPSLDELQRFRRKKKTNVDGYDDGAADENEGSRMAASLLDELSELQGNTGFASLGTSQSGLIIGDTIEVIEGDLIGMRGKLLSLDGMTVKVKPIDTVGLSESAEVEFLTSQVRKYIAVGAHVKVTEGRYAGETGVVVAVEQLDGETDCTAVILTDLTHREVSVRTAQLQESAEIASGQDKLAGYELHDLVVLSGGGSTNEVGVIVRVGREEFTVVNNHGIVREVRPEELRGKRNSTSDRAVALDVQGNQIRVGDGVNIVEGPFKGRSATIKRMSRAQLFLYSQTKQDNAGIFVVRSRSCVLVGSQGKLRSVDNGAIGGRSQGEAGGRGGRKEDNLIGKTVRIQSGQWKGYLGCVTDVTATHVQVELHSRLKKVLVTRDRVAVAGDRFGATDFSDKSDMHANMMMAGGVTPFVSGGMTPMHGGMTPMHGGATPMHGGTTPIYGGDGGGVTPSHSDDVWKPEYLDQTSVSVGSAAGDQQNGTMLDTSGLTGTASGVSEGYPVTSSTGWGVSSSWKSLGDDLSTKAVAESSQLGSTQASKSVGEAAFGNRGEASATVDGGIDPSSADAAVWFMERVCVQLNRGGDTTLAGVIKEIKDDNSAVIELADKTFVTVRSADVSLIPPKEHDMVLVTGGADVGVEGELVCIDGSDAILKDSNEDFKIVDLIHLAKIEVES